MYSQSVVYPIQRVENNDTVVIMTKAQAMAMNRRFLSMDSTIKAYDEAYKFKYYQHNQAREALVRQDSVVGYLNRQLLIRPAFKPITKLDILMASFFVSFSTFVLYINLN